MSRLATAHALFATYCLAVGLGNVRVLRELLGLSLSDSTASHLVLVPLVTLVLIYRERSAIFSSTRTDLSAGLGAVAAGLLVLAGGRLREPADPLGGSLTWMVAAVAALWAAGFLLFYGRRAFRAAWFPLLFLGFMVPIPAAVLDAATLILKTGSTETVAGLFELTGTPFLRDGFIFSLPSVVIEVADECSGIRSSIALFMTSLLAGHVYLTTPWKKAVLVAAVLPITILKNGVRIVALSLLAMHVDPGFLAGSLHHDGGIVFFLLSLTILAPVLAVLRGSEGKPLVPAFAGFQRTIHD